MGSEAQSAQSSTSVVLQLSVSVTYGTKLGVWLVGTPEPRVLCFLTALRGS